MGTESIRGWGRQKRRSYQAILPIGARNKSRSSWAVDLLAANFPAVGTMCADKTSVGAVVNMQRRSPSDAAGGQSQRLGEAPTMAAPSEGGEQAASGSSMTNEIHNTRFQPCLA
jgi:hypothetical protein